MSGLSLRTGLSVRASAPTAATANTGTVDVAAFSPGQTSQMTSGGSALTPNKPTAVAMWTGIGAVALLVFIRWSLPK